MFKGLQIHYVVIILTQRCVRSVLLPPYYRWEVQDERKELA